MPPGPTVKCLAGLGQRTGEPQPPQPVHRSTNAMGASDRTDSRLVYYPPYHSKYNPLDVGGVLQATAIAAPEIGRRTVERT